MLARYFLCLLMVVNAAMTAVGSRCVQGTTDGGRATQAAASVRCSCCGAGGDESSCCNPREACTTRSSDEPARQPLLVRGVSTEVIAAWSAPTGVPTVAGVAAARSIAPCRVRVALGSCESLQIALCRWRN